MPPDEANRVGALFSEIAAKKAPITDLESWHVGKNGEKICLLTNGVPILDETGNLKGYRGVDKDITDRKNMEESLRTSEEKFREFFKNTPDYCYIISPEGTILNVNSAVLRALGYEKEELIGKPVSMIYESGSFARMKELFGQWKTSGQVRNEEVVIITRQGEKRTVLLNVGAVRDNAGTIIYSTSVQTDITERKLAEASRREGLERYKAVVEGFDGLIYICSQDHRIEFMNKRLIERTGRNAAGELCYKALHDKDAVCEWCVNEKVFEGETMRWEVQSPKDHRWYYVVNTPIYHVDGTMSKQAMIMDITERKLAEEALDESRTQIAAVMNSTNDWIWSVDPVRFGLLTWNRGLADHFLKRVGLTIAVGMTPYDLLPPERAAQWPELYNRALREGTFTTEYDVTNQANILLLSINVMKRGGQVFGISVFGKDITERKVAEEALKENESALRNSRKDLQMLAGRLISAQEEELRRLSRELHDDLTQRLAVLAIEAGKLELDLGRMPEKYPQTIHTVAQIKDQLIKVSEDVHTISRQLHPTILDDLGLVRAIESECAAFMRRNPMEVAFRKKDVPDAIPDDIALCLYRVVQEGLKNIATHSGAKNCEINLKGDDHTLCLSVTDDGCGFDPLVVRNMPGLGLSSMRERVQLVQGSFTIRSEPGKGTVVNVCVPLNGSDI